jgi:hypothetical protein
LFEEEKVVNVLKKDMLKCIESNQKNIEGISKSGIGRFTRRYNNK